MLIALPSVALAEAPAPAIRLTVDAPGDLVLGDVAEVPVTIEAPEPPEAEGRPLRVSVNVGAFAAIERVRPGVYATKYVLPDTRHPQVALVAVWRETGPDAEVTFLRIP